MTEPADDELDHTLRALLASPTVWSEVPAHLEHDVVAAVVGERAGSGPEGSPASASPASGSPASGRTGRLVAVAAAVLLLAGAAVVGSLALGRDGDSPGGVAVALAGEHPDGSMTATAVVDRTGQGVKIVLDPAGLPPTAAGTYYQAWLTDGVHRVSAGTFHLRGEGRGDIELWCGIDDVSYSILAVTLERVETAPDSSAPVLTGRIDD